jgi:shikimate dehydrogenase
VNDYAKIFGAVNTVRVRNGKLQGFNTDGYGLVQGLREDFGISLKNKQVLVLGAGGAGRAAAIQCALEGARWIGIANRTRGKSRALLEEVRWANKRVTVEELPLDESALRGALQQTDLVINATALGLKKGDPSPVPAACFHRKLLAYDMIYWPRETAFLRAARLARARTSNGTTLLLHQGAKSFEIWTGRRPPVAVMRRALLAELRKRR